MYYLLHAGPASLLDTDTSLASRQSKLRHLINVVDNDFVYDLDTQQTGVG